MKWIDRAIFISPIYFGLCCSEREFKAELRRLGIPKGSRPHWLKNEHSDGCAHFFDNGKMTSAIVCVRKSAESVPSEMVGLLIHESVHIWQEIRKNIGEDNPSSEFEAYVIQAIAQKLIEAYDEC